MSDLGIFGDLVPAKSTQAVLASAPDAAAQGTSDAGIFSDLVPGAAPSNLGKGEAKYGPIADAAADAAGIDRGLFRAQIRQESNFDPSSSSSAGAVGIAQFMPGTARGEGVDPNDPKASLYGAARLMKRLLVKYGGKADLALAAYNAGEGNVSKYGGVPPFAETRDYLKKILPALGGRDPLGQDPGTNLLPPSDAAQSAFNRPALASAALTGALQGGQQGMRLPGDPGGVSSSDVAAQVHAAMAVNPAVYAAQQLPLDLNTFLQRVRAGYSSVPVNDLSRVNGGDGIGDVPTRQAAAAVAFGLGLTSSPGPTNGFVGKEQWSDPHDKAVVDNLLNPKSATYKKALAISKAGGQAGIQPSAYDAARAVGPVTGGEGIEGAANLVGQAFPGLAANIVARQPDIGSATTAGLYGRAFQAASQPATSALEAATDPRATIPGWAHVAATVGDLAAFGLVQGAGAAASESIAADGVRALLGKTAAKLVPDAVTGALDRAGQSALGEAVANGLRRTASNSIALAGGRALSFVGENAALQLVPSLGQASDLTAQNGGSYWQNLATVGGQQATGFARLLNPGTLVDPDATASEKAQAAIMQGLFLLGTGAKGYGWVKGLVDSDKAEIDPTLVQAVIDAGRRQSDVGQRGNGLLSTTAPDPEPAEPPSQALTMRTNDAGDGLIPSYLQRRPEPEPPSAFDVADAQRRRAGGQRRAQELGLPSDTDGLTRDQYVAYHAPRIMSDDLASIEQALANPKKAGLGKGDLAALRQARFDVQQALRDGTVPPDLADQLGKIHDDLTAAPETGQPAPNGAEANPAISPPEPAVNEPTKTATADTVRLGAPEEVASNNASPEPMASRSDETTGVKPAEPDAPSVAADHTSARTSVVEAERDERGEGPVERQDYTTPAQAEAMGKAAMDADPKAHERLAAEVAAKPRPLSAEEVGTLYEGRKRLLAEANAVAARLDNAIREGKVAGSLRAEYEDVKRRLDLNDQALVKGGREQSAAFLARTLGKAFDDTDAEAVKQEARRTKGADIDPKTAGQIDALTQRLKDAEARIAAAEDRATKAEAQKAVDKAAASRRKQSVETIRDRRTAALAKASEAWKQAGEDMRGQANSVLPGVVTAYKIAKVAPHVLEYVKTLADEGIVRLPDIVAKVRETFGGHGIDLDDSDVHDILAGRYAEKRPRAADAQAGAKREARARSSIAKMSRQLSDEEPIDPPRTKAEVSPELQRLYDRRNALRAQIREKVEGQRPKTLGDRVHAVQHFGLFSSPAILAKLGGAALVHAPMEYAESVLASPFRALSAGKGETLGSLAKSRGRVNTAAFREGLRSMLSLATLGDMRDALLTSSGNSVDAAAVARGQARPREFHPVAGFFGRLHGALGTPVQRFAYKRGVEVRAEWYGRHGFDVSDPNVQADIVAGAYSDSLEAVFRNPNKFSEGLNKMLGVFGKGEGFARTLVPVTNLGANVAGRTLQYAGTGVFEGFLKHVQAASKGEMTPEVADDILKAYARGGVGVGLWAMVATGAVTGPGLYAPGAKKAEGEEFGHFRLAGHDVPAAFLHGPIPGALNMMLTLKNGLTGGEALNSFGSSFFTGLSATGEMTPGLEAVGTVGKASQSESAAGKAAGEMVKSVFDPQLLQFAARKLDSDPEGKPVKRKVKGFRDSIQEGVPIARNGLEAK